MSPQFKFVSYGGGANMLDYGSEKRFASYVHHFNLRDAVTALFGMKDPFQRSPAMNVLAAGAGGIQLWKKMSFNLPKKILRWAGRGDLITELTTPNAHIPRILSGPTPMEVAAWASFHKVIYHGADALIPNLGHHNFYDAYRCNVGTEDSVPLVTLPVFNATRIWECKAYNPQEGLGAPDCLKD